MSTRRDFLALASTTLPMLRPGAAALAEPFALDDRTPDEIARDEDAWTDVQRAYTVDRAILNLNNGGVCPAPRVVQEALRRYLEHAHEAPAYVMWRLQDPEKETVRSDLAALLGRSPEEIAITRNASESLENVQFGLKLERGDEVLTTDQDYPRMLTTFQQRARREGIVLVRFPIPAPCEDPAEIVRRFEERITPRTRLILVSHVVFLNGQVLPVKEVVALGRRHGIPVLVDGAHAVAHLDFKLSELECDYYGASLHKWLFAPHGTGLLYVRREKIPSLWPLMAAAETQDADIRKFEEIGTHPMANFLAIADALTFHFGIGPANKQARMLYLRDTWAKRLAASPRVKLHTSLKPGFATGVCNVEIDGVDSLKLSEHLWAKHKIFTVAIVHEEFQGVRISPAVYTTLEELDRFCAAMERVLRDGLPA